MGRYGIRLRLSSVPDTIPSHVCLQSQAPDVFRTFRAQARKKADCGGAGGEGIGESGGKWCKMGKVVGSGNLQEFLGIIECRYYNKDKKYRYSIIETSAVSGGYLTTAAGLYFVSAGADRVLSSCRIAKGTCKPVRLARCSRE